MTRLVVILFAFAVTICVHGIPSPAVISSTATTESTLSVAKDDTVTIIDYINRFNNISNSNENDNNSGNNQDQDRGSSSYSDENEDNEVTTNGGSNNPQSTTEHGIKRNDLDDIKIDNNEDDDIGDQVANHSEKDNNQRIRSNIGKESNRNVHTRKNTDDSDDSKINIRPDVQIPYWEVGNKISQTTEKSDTYDNNLDDVSSNNNMENSKDSKIHQESSNEEDYRNDKTKKSSDHLRVPNDNDSESQEIQRPYWEITDNKNSAEKVTKDNAETGNKVYSNSKVNEEASSSNKPQNRNDIYMTKTFITQRPYWEIPADKDQTNDNINDEKYINEKNDPQKHKYNHQRSHGEDTAAANEGDDKSKNNRDNFDNKTNSGSNGLVSQRPYWETPGQKVESGENEQNNNKRISANNNELLTIINNRHLNREDFFRRNFESHHRKSESDESDSNTEEDYTHSHENKYSKDVNSKTSNEADSEQNNRSYEDQHSYQNNYQDTKDHNNNTPNEKKSYSEPCYNKPCNCYTRYRYNKNKECKTSHYHNKDGHRHYYRNNKCSYRNQYHSNIENYDDRNSNNCKCRGYYYDKPKNNKNYDGNYDRFSQNEHGYDKNNKYNKDLTSNNVNNHRKYHGYPNNHKNHDRNHSNKYDGGYYKKKYDKTKYEDSRWKDGQRYHRGTKYNVKKDEYSSRPNYDKYRHGDKNKYHRSYNDGSDGGSKGRSYRNRGEYHHHSRKVRDQKDSDFGKSLAFITDKISKVGVAIANAI